MKAGLCLALGLIAGAAAAWAQATPAVPQLDPGMWEISATSTGGEIPGGKDVVRNCLPPEQAAKGVAALLASTGPHCTPVRSNVADGRIDVLMQCAQASDQPFTVAITGSFTPKSYAASSTMSMERGGKAITRTASGKWISASCSS